MKNSNSLLRNTAARNSILDSVLLTQLVSQLAYANKNRKSSFVLVSARRGANWELSKVMSFINYCHFMTCPYVMCNVKLWKHEETITPVAYSSGHTMCVWLVSYRINLVRFRSDYTAFKSTACAVVHLIKIAIIPMAMSQSDLVPDAETYERDPDSLKISCVWTERFQPIFMR